LREVLGVEGDQAEVDACKIEHLISIETSQRLAAFLQSWDKHPAAATALKADRKNSHPSCDHDAEKCRVCSNVCVLDLPTPSRRKSR
jgi:Mn-dependent DtxR family transcriptional regulator